MKRLLFNVLASLTLVGVAAGPNVSAQQAGTITGSLSYPSDFDFPRMIVCAEAIDLKSIHCTDKRAVNRRGKLRVTYRLKVPAGSYHVFATIVNDEPVENYRGYKAYYSEFVTCGLNVNCPSHAPLKVTVRAGQTVTRVDPGDWYADN